MLIAVILPMLVVQAAAGPPQTVAARSEAAAPYIDVQAPPFDVPEPLRDSIRFGYIDVPQDHADPTGRTLRLALAVLPARTSQTAAEPIIFIPGGPGMSTVAPWTVEAARSPRIALLRENRDFVILDPRGHGLSEPRTCPELNGAQPLRDDSPAAEAILARKLSECRTRLAAEGVRPEMLDAVQASHDIDFVRRALGAERVHLFGASYGTRIVAEAMRGVPHAIRSAVLISPVPPGLPHLGDDAEVAQEVLAALFRRCGEVPECRASYPHLEADYDSLIARTRREPLHAPMPVSDRAPEGSLRLDDRDLSAGLAQLLATRALAGGVPMMIHTLAEGGLAPAADMAPQLVALLTDDDVAFGTHLAFHCNDSPVGIETVAWLRQRCSAWVGADYGDPVGDQLRSDIPALVMVGEWDPRTPPSYARHLASGLTRVQLLEVPWHGHEVQHPCLSRIQRDFFEAPGTAPNVACLDSLPPVRFVAPVVRSRWVGRTVMHAGTAPWRVGGFAAAAALLLLVSVTGLPVHELRSRSRGNVARGPEAVALWLAAAAALTLVVGVAAATFVGMRSNVLAPAFGVPAGWRWILAVPWLVLALFLIAAMLAFRREDRLGSPPMLLRHAALIGTGIVLALWAFHSLPG